MDPAISVKGVSKSYVIRHTYGHNYFGDAIVKTLTHPVRAIRDHNKGKELFWALRDISFEVEKGEVLGLIGRNGAGKSTMLKILSQITYPTEGEIILRGRVGSLLEVGTGFHPELTGRDNIYLNGAILGMRKKEIEAKFDAIVKFADVEKFIDTPVKRYSSGMALRLAFAVAANMETEILIADEVLAVGDQQFQTKCLGRMREVSEEGRTVVFVSHNMHAVKSLCETGLLLERGIVKTKGDMDDVIAAYSATLESVSNQFPVTAGNIVVNNFILEQSNINTEIVDGTKPFTIRVTFDLLADMDRFRLGIFIRNSLGDNLVRSMLTDWVLSHENMSRGHYEASLEVPEKLLVPGNYSVTLSAKKKGYVDYLRDTPIERMFTVSAPTDLILESDESAEAQILLNRKWDVVKDGTL